jgi:hypothetical protein
MGRCVYRTRTVLIWRKNHLTLATMVALIFLLLNLVGLLLKSKSRVGDEKDAATGQTDREPRQGEDRC